MIRSSHSEEYLAKLASVIPYSGDYKALDLGAGFGATACILYKFCKHVLAVDLFPNDSLQEFHINTQKLNGITPLKGPAVFFRDSWPKNFFDMIHIDMGESIESFRHHIHIFKDTLVDNGYLFTPNEESKVDILQHNGFEIRERGIIIVAIKREQ